MALRIKRADLSDMKAVKKLYRSAFPAIERKPFFMVREKARKGESEILALSVDGEFADFAVTLLYSDLVLIDYFAIAENRRGRGAGSLGLKTVFSRYSGKRIMLLAEDEDPKAPNALERKRRIDFYFKNSMADTAVKVKIFGNGFRLLSYPEPVGAKDYLDINREIMGKLFLKFTFTKAF